MPREIPGQMNFSDEEMGIKVPVHSLDKKTETPPAPEPELEPTEVGRGHQKRLMKKAQESLVTDPHAQEGRQIGLIDLLDRELAGSVHKAKNIGALAHIVQSRFEDPDDLRALAAVMKSDHGKEIEARIKEIEARQDEIEERYDTVYNPRAQTENQTLVDQKLQLSEELEVKKRTGNEIAFFLNKLADAIEKVRSDKK